MKKNRYWARGIACSWIICLKIFIMNRIKQIINFVSGNLDKDESSRLLREIKSDTRLKNEYEKVKNVWALSTYDNDLDPLIVEKSFVGFRNLLVTSSKKRFLNILKYAAIVFIVFSLGLVSHQFLFPVTQQDGVNEIHVPNGEQAHLLLADSSKVWLNSGTIFFLLK